MKSSYLPLSLFFFLSLLVTSNPAHAELENGDKVEFPPLLDQFENTQTLKPSTQWILFAHDMDGTNFARDALEGQTEKSMDEMGVQFYADISGMPGLISRFIAMPRLKKLAYPIALAREKEVLIDIPREDNKTTVVRLEQGTVDSIVIADSVKQIKALLQLE